MTPSLLFCGACSATTFARQCRTSKFQSEPTALRHGAKAYSKQRGLYENQTVPNHRYRGDVFSSCTGISGTGYRIARSEEHTSELQSLMRISYDVFCLKKKKKNPIN